MWIGAILAIFIAMFKSLTEIDVYKVSEDFSNQIWEIVKHWPYFERETLGKQLVRATDSISANIAEAYGRYHYKDRQTFGYYARGSFEETKSWLRKCHRRNMLTATQTEIINSYIIKMGPKLNGLINTFKNPTLHQ